MLVQPNLEFNFDSSIEEIQTAWIRFCKGERSLLENKDKVQKLVSDVVKFIEPPVVGMDLVEEVKRAAKYYEDDDKEKAMDKIELILSKEPRYGDALYLKAKILYDENKILEAEPIFKEAVAYLLPTNVQAGWANYFLGRIAKLRNSYAEALEYYRQASTVLLPAETLEECKANIYKLEKYIYIAPDPSVEVAPADIQGVKSFLKYFDDVLRVQDWQTLLDTTAYQLNPQTIENLIKWYQDPARFSDDVIYTHELIKSEVSMNAAKLHVLVKVSYPIPAETLESPENSETPTDQPQKETAKTPKEYVRFFLLTRLPEGWRILDYFDEKDLYM